MSFVLHFQALDGFIAVITQDGQLFYVSENVRDFLGYSQVILIIFYNLFPPEPVSVQVVLIFLCLQWKPINNYGYQQAMKI